MQSAIARILAMVDMKSNHYDCIVIGVGTMGAAACYYLAKRGAKVLGIEQFGIVHNHGSHGGLSRIIRKAYFEHPDYIPLLQRAYENWQHIETVSGQTIFHRTGLLYAAPGGHDLLEQVKSSAAAYQIELETWTAKNAGERYPQFQFPHSFEVLLEPDAGYLRPDDAIAAYVQAANSLGATIHIQEKVQSWTANNTAVTVITDKHRYTASRLIITAGAWASQLIPGINEHLRVTRQVLAWFRPEQIDAYEAKRFPCWLIANNDGRGAYYGFPVMNPAAEGPMSAIKAALHYPGVTVEPDTVDRNIAASDLEHLELFLDRYLPSARGPLVHASVCLYSNSPDEHFVIDKLPGCNERVAVAWGFSGHGFKFASVVGEILADLALSGKTPMPIGFLNAERLAT